VSENGRGLPLLRMPGQTIEEALKERKRTYDRTYREKKRAATEAQGRPQRRVLPHRPPERRLVQRITQAEVDRAKAKFLADGGLIDRKAPQADGSDQLRKAVPAGRPHVNGRRTAR